jgi:STAS-like domain of unknown function (DUF4325)
MRISISERFGRAAVDYDNGQSLLEVARPQLAAGNTVELDFDGVTIYASPFFNGSVAVLVREFNSEDLRQRLKLEHLTPDGKRVAKRSIYNAANRDVSEVESQELLAQILSDEGER